LPPLVAPFGLQNGGIVLSEHVTLIVSAVAGGVVTALMTAGATWWITERIERSQRRERSFDALSVVLAELDSDRRELMSFERGDIDLHSLRDGRLTIGDWAANKAVIAGIAASANELWKDLTTLYDDFHGTLRLGSTPPSAARVAQVEDGVKAALRDD
jgi:hypothetical protein